MKQTILIGLLAAAGAAGACSPKFFAANTYPGTVCDSMAVRDPGERMLFDVGIQPPDGYHPGDALTAAQQEALQMAVKDMIVSFDLRALPDTTARMGVPQGELGFTYGLVYIRRGDLDAISAKPYVQALYFHSQPPGVTRVIPVVHGKPLEGKTWYDVRGARQKTASRVFLLPGRP